MKRKSIKAIKEEFSAEFQRLSESRPQLPLMRPQIQIEDARGERLIECMLRDGRAYLMFESGFVVLCARTPDIADYDDGDIELEQDQLGEFAGHHAAELVSIGAAKTEEAAEYATATKAFNQKYSRLERRRREAFDRAFAARERKKR